MCAPSPSSQAGQPIQTAGFDRGGGSGLFWKKAYDRGRVLQDADQARRRGRRRRAISLYRWVLAVEGGNPSLHAKLAPLLARDGQPFDAWRHFQSAARGWLKSGHSDEALAVYRKAVQSLPRTVEAWLELGDLHRREGRRRDAVEALREGRRHLRRQRYRAEATHLLRCAHALEPGNLDVTLDLAQQLALSRQRREAVLILEDLAARCAPDDLKRVRRAMLRVTHSASALWLWLRSVFLPPPRRSPPARARSESAAR